MITIKSADDVKLLGEPVTYKKTVPVEVVIAPLPFTIITTVDGVEESVMSGNKGDAIGIGPKGEVWRIEREIFEETYKPVPNVAHLYPSQPGVCVKSAQRDYDAFFKVDKVALEYQIKGGSWHNPGPMLVFHSKDSVAMLVYNTDTHEVELVRQYRPAVQSWITELPAGICTGYNQTEEQNRADAAREIREELAYAVDPNTLQHVGSFALSPGRCTEKCHLYYAEVTNDDQTGEPVGVKYEGEHIERISAEIWKLRAQVLDGTIWDAKTIIGINWL